MSDTPALTSAEPGHNQVTLGWSTAADAEGYKVYYDQNGKFQSVADAGNTVTFDAPALTLSAVMGCAPLSAESLPGQLEDPDAEAVGVS